MISVLLRRPVTPVRFALRSFALGWCVLGPALAMPTQVPGDFSQGQAPDLILGKPWAGSQALKNPSGVAVDRAGNIFVADNNNHVIRKIIGSTSKHP